MEARQVRDRVKPIFCEWLKNNCNRYKYLTKEARRLHSDIQKMDIYGEEAKDFYIKFLTYFLNNPFVTASHSFSRENVGIVTYDYSCYFVMNEFGMYVSVELYRNLYIKGSEEEREKTLKRALEQLDGQRRNFTSGEYEEFQEAANDLKEGIKKFLKLYFRKDLTGSRNYKRCLILSAIPKWKSCKERRMRKNFFTRIAAIVICIVITWITFAFIFPKVPEIWNLLSEKIAVLKSEVENEANEEMEAVVEKETETLWIVTTGACNLRQSPDGDVIGILMEGTQVCVTERDEGGLWLKVTAPEEQEGWISRRVAKHVRDDEIIPASVSSLSGAEWEKNLFDGCLLTWWQEEQSGNGVGECIHIYLDGEYTINEIFFTNGKVKNKSAYSENGRVKKLTMIAQKENSYSYELPDTYEVEGFSLQLEEPLITGELIFQIDDIYEGDLYENTCITEIGLYGSRRK